MMTVVDDDHNDDWVADDDDDDDVEDFTRSYVQVDCDWIYHFQRTHYDLKSQSLEMPASFYLLPFQLHTRPSLNRDLTTNQTASSKREGLESN